MSVVYNIYSDVLSSMFLSCFLSFQSIAKQNFQITSQYGTIIFHMLFYSYEVNTDVSVPSSKPTIGNVILIQLDVLHPVFVNISICQILLIILDHGITDDSLNCASRLYIMFLCISLYFETFSVPLNEFYKYIYSDEFCVLYSYVYVLSCFFIDCIAQQLQYFKLFDENLDVFA